MSPSLCSSTLLAPIPPGGPGLTLQSPLLFLVCLFPGICESCLALKSKSSKHFSDSSSHSRFTCTVLDPDRLGRVGIRLMTSLRKILWLGRGKGENVHLPRDVCRRGRRTEKDREACRGPRLENGLLRWEGAGFFLLRVHLGVESGEHWSFLPTSLLILKCLKGKIGPLSLRTRHYSRTLP